MKNVSFTIVTIQHTKKGILMKDIVGDGISDKEVLPFNPSNPSPRFDNYF